MQVHQVFLELIRLGEEFHAALAAVLCGGSQEVVGDVLRQLFLSQLGSTMGTQGGGRLARLRASTQPPCLVNV